MSEDPTTIRLGDTEYKLVPQRIGRIQRKLRQVAELFQGSTETDEIGPRLHEALQVFIPDLAPLWKLQGYPNEAAFRKNEDWVKATREGREAHAQKWYDDLSEEDRKKVGEKAPPFQFLPPDVQAAFEGPERPPDEYDPAADGSPTPVEVIEAIESVFRIHGGERLTKMLGKVISENALRAMVERQIVIYQAQLASAQSRSLQLVNGASRPTPSTTPPQIEPATPSASPPPASST